jgi:hypothetical protein
MLLHPLNGRPIPIKDCSISMQPEAPSPQNDDAVNPFSLILVPMLAFLHQSSNEHSSALGARWLISIESKIVNQNCRAKTQVVRMCCIVSLSWSHKGQLFGCCNPLFSRLSAVQHLFLIASHRKLLTCIYSLSSAKWRKNLRVNVNFACLQG